MYGGKRVWVQAELPGSGFTLPGGDRNAAYVLFSNSHDGTSAAAMIPTSERAVCANTLRIAMRGARDGKVSIRHTGDIRSKVKDAQRLLGIAVQEFDTFKDTAEAMSRKQLAIDAYAPQVLDAVLEMTSATERVRNAPVRSHERTEAEEALRKLRDRKATLLQEVMERYHSPTTTAPGTAWGAYNAVSEVFDHGSYAAPRRGMWDEKLSRRFESIMTGEADQAKQVALVMATRG